MSPNEPAGPPSDVVDPSASTAAVATPDQQKALAVLTATLALLALAAVHPLVAPLVVGAWFAGLASPWITRLSQRFGHRRRLAGLATLVLVVALLAPIFLLVAPLTSLAGDAVATLKRAASTGTLGHWIGAGPGPVGAHDLSHRFWGAARDLAPGATGLASRALTVVSTGVVQALALVASAYVFSAEGAEILTVARHGSPLAPQHFDRLLAESLRVARALLVGGLLTALAQGVVAFAVYLALGIANAAGLAALTALASVVPAVGSSLVWLPLCALLVGVGRHREALVLAACGVVLIGTVDNVLRPMLARLGAHDVHPLLLFVGVVGGIGSLGPWGLVLGPLALSLFVGAYRIRAESVAGPGAPTT